MSNLFDLTPLTYTDLLPGLRVLELEMDKRGKLCLSEFTIQEAPDGDRVAVRYVGRSRKKFTGDMGCRIDGRFHNDHRTFAFSEEAERVLEHVVATQDAVAWLEFLGYEDPAGHLRQLMAECDLYRSWRPQL